METYSLLLMIALVAVVLTASRAISGHRGNPECWLSVLAMLAASGSLTVHLAAAHRPGSSDALAPFVFVSEHPTLVATHVVALALLLWLFTGRESR